jgi:cbb3-type cytochrome oxidase subunit 3
MLQELTASSGASIWAVSSMLFFIAVYAVVAVRAFRRSKTDLDARARMPLDDDDKV